MKKQYKIILSCLATIALQGEIYALTGPWSIPTVAIAGLSQLKMGLSKCLGIIMLIGFLMATVKIISGASAMGKGDTEAGKQAIISGVFFAGAGVIAGIMFSVFGMESAVIQASFD